MARPNLTFPTGLVLQAIAVGHTYGFDIIEATGLPGGTVYPALRRLEGGGFLTSRWESEEDVEGRPARCYYTVTPDGRALLEEATRRFPAIPASVGGRSHPGAGAHGPPEPEKV
jgi:DNA-binding PadR family transcriptional regulator